MSEGQSQDEYIFPCQSFIQSCSLTMVPLRYIGPFYTPSNKEVATYLLLLIISVSLYKQFYVEPKRPVICGQLDTHSH